MIRITQQDSAAGAKTYYTQADYYSQGQETIGLWGGKGARLLGLDGVVDQLAFDRLCDNLDPRDGKQLTARMRSDRTVGYDFTFSVPKSVSLLYAMSCDQQILDAFRGAVDETIQDMEIEREAVDKTYNELARRSQSLENNLQRAEQACKELITHKERLEREKYTILQQLEESNKREKRNFQLI